MKITRLGPTRPAVSIGSIIGGGSTPGATESPAPPGHVPTSTGSNSVSWGSNVGTITVNGTTLVRGPFVNFANGSNTTVTVDQVGSAASNTIRIHATGGAASFGSNATHVAEVSSGGASSDSARMDHYHAGIATVTASSSNTLQRGTVNLRPGNNVSFGLTDTDGDGEFDTVTIHGAAAGGGGGSGAPTTAKYVTTATDGTLSAEIVIPGLAGSPDVMPASPDADDDEFDTTDTSDPMAGWTTLGTLDGLNINSHTLSHLYLKKNATSSTRVDGIYKARTPPFTVTARLSAHTIRADYSRAGIFIGAASPGDIETIAYIHVSNSSAYQGEVLDMASPTSYTATIAASSLVLINYTYGRWLPVYLRIVVASSTDVTYQISLDGVFWSSVVANRNPGFTVGSAGLFLNPQNASTDVEAVFDWIRFT